MTTKNQDQGGQNQNDQKQQGQDNRVQGNPNKQDQKSPQQQQAEQGRNTRRLHEDPSITKRVLEKGKVSESASTPDGSKEIDRLED